MFPVCELYQVPQSDYQRLTVETRPAPNQASFSQDEFKKAVFQRLFAISVAARSKDAVLGLISKLQTVLDGIVMQAAGGIFEACLIESINVVGQYQKDTAISGPRENEGEIVVIITSLPTSATLNALGQKIIADLHQNYSNEEFLFALDENRIVIRSGAVQVVVHVVPLDPALLDGGVPSEFTLKQFAFSMRLVDQAAWFTANATSANIKSLVRLLLDLRDRHPPLQILDDHAIDLLARQCVTLTTGPPLAIEVGFRRFLELLSMNILLRDAFPTTELFQGEEVDTAARTAISKMALDLLCAISLGQYKSVFV